MELRNIFLILLLLNINFNNIYSSNDKEKFLLYSMFCFANVVEIIGEKIKIREIEKSEPLKFPEKYDESIKKDFEEMKKDSEKKLDYLYDKFLYMNMLFWTFILLDE